MLPRLFVANNAGIMLSRPFAPVPTSTVNPMLEPFQEISANEDPFLPSTHVSS